jgi:hypothetical protein
MIFYNFVNQFKLYISLLTTTSTQDQSSWVDGDGFKQTYLFTKGNAKNAYLLPVSNHQSH